MKLQNKNDIASQTFCLLGNFINPISDLKANLDREFAMVFTSDLKIPTINSGIIKYYGPQKSLPKKYLGKNNKMLDYSDHVILPGLFDMHFHWVQDQVCLKPKTNLLSWLEKYTWPYESKFKDKNFSKNQAKLFSKKLSQTGTIGGAIYCSIHSHSVTDALKYFKGHFIAGNVLMTMNSPSYLTQTKKNAINIVTKLSAKYQSLYAMTPRFAITTDPETMKNGALIAQKNKSFIQTHLSETKNECLYVLELFKKISGFEKVKTYTDIYKKCNLITNKTIFGHGIYLNQDELKLIAKKKALIAHCPTSNAPLTQSGLGSGLFDFEKAEKLGVNWALASDIGGGPYLSMFDVMRSFVKQNQKKKIKTATYVKALYRSTLVSSQFLKLKKSGNFKNGNQASFLILSKIKLNPKDNAEIILNKIISKSPRSKMNKLVRKTFYKGNDCSK